jgi:TATA-box binding protein (TBP) (component of TFIID and TFIIIB)
MASPTYSTAHPWAEASEEPAAPYSKGKGETLVVTPRDGARSGLDAPGSASTATTRCGTPASVLRGTPAAEAGGRGCPKACPRKRPVVNVKSRFCSSTANFRLNQQNVNLSVLARLVPGGNCIYNVSSGRDGPDMAKLLLPVRRHGEQGGKRYVHIQIFRSGHIGVVGAKSYGQVRRIAARVVAKIKRCSGRDRNGVMRSAVPSPADLDIGELDGSDENGIKWSCLRFDFDLGFSVKLDNVTSLLSKFFPVTYEPELKSFQGVTIKATPTATVCIFGSGKGFVVVSKDPGGKEEEPASGTAQDSACSTAGKGMLDAELKAAYDEVCKVIWLNLPGVVNLNARARPQRQR